MGWGTLMFAGGAAYYFAKRDIDAHRREQELKGTRGTEYLECTIPNPFVCSAFRGLCRVRIASLTTADDTFMINTNG
jgi:hypothetical protein